MCVCVYGGGVGTNGKDTKNLDGRIPETIQKVAQ